MKEIPWEEKTRQKARDPVALTATIDRTSFTRDHDKMAGDLAAAANQALTTTTMQADLDRILFRAHSPPPKERQKPIYFKDAAGKKFSFPFDRCKTWNVSSPDTFKFKP